MIEAVKLTKSYDKREALVDLDLEIKEGEVFCLLGQNGAGKTTTINLFLGLLAPTSGHAFINGLDVNKNRTAINKTIAYIPELVQLYGNLTGVENLIFFSKLAGYRLQSNELRELLNKVGLAEEDHDKRLSHYSKGMRQKVGIAIALSKRAKVIFMDEPTSGLDPKATNEFTLVCKELAKEGKSIFMATHDIFNAVNVGSQIGIMKEGKLIHTSDTTHIDAAAMQKMYLKTI